MIVVDSRTKDFLWEGLPVKFTINFTSASGEKLQILEENIASGGVKIDRTCVSGGKFEIGNAIASQLDLVLDNYDGTFDDVVFEGGEMEVYFAVPHEENGIVYAGTPCHIGTFIVDETPRPLSTIKIVALDEMVRLDRVCNDSFHNQTLSQIASRCATACGLQIANNLDYTRNPNINKVFSWASTKTEPVTYRNIIQNIAMILGCNASMTQSGTLRFTPYNTTSPNVTITDDESYSSDIQENDVTITGLYYSKTVKDEESNEDKLVEITNGDANTYPIDFTGNILLDNSSDNTIQSVLNDLGSALVGMTFRPMSLDIVQTPWLEVGDCVEVIKADRNGNEKRYKTTVTSMVYTANGATQIAGEAETKQNVSYTSTGMTRRERQLFDAINNSMNIVSNNLAQEVINRENAINDLNRAMENATGLYSKEVTEADGSTTFYLYDKDSPTSNPFYADSTIVMKVNAGGIAFSTDGGKTFPNGYDFANRTLISEIIRTSDLSADNIKSGKLSADQIDVESLKVSSMDLDGLNVGGHNLLNGTLGFTGDGFSFGNSVSPDDGAHGKFTVKEFNRLNVTGNGLATAITIKDIPLEANQFYVLSFYANGTKNDNAANGGIQVIWGNPSDGSVVVDSHFTQGSEDSKMGGSSDYGQKTFNNVDGGYKRYWVRWKTADYSEVSKTGNILFKVRAGWNVRVYGFQLEKGVLATEWNYSQNDISAEVSTQIANGITESKIEALKNGIVFSVENDSGSSASIKLTVDGQEKGSGKINLNGEVNFSNFQNTFNNYVTTIDGGKITTNSIDASKINLSTLGIDRINLLKGTKKFQKDYFNFGEYPTITNSKYNTFTTKLVDCSQIGNYTVYYSAITTNSEVEFQKGSDYVFSFYVKPTVEGIGSAIGVKLNGNDVINPDETQASTNSWAWGKEYGGISFGSLPLKTIKRCWIHWKAKATKTADIELYVKSKWAVHLWGFQLEKGVSPSDWKESVDDVANGIAESKIEALKDGLELSVSNKSSTASISLKVGDDTHSATINMTGLVKFKDLSTSGSTTISGSNITTGTIKSSKVTISGALYGNNLYGSTLKLAKNYYSGFSASEKANRYLYTDSQNLDNENFIAAGIASKDSDFEIYSLGKRMQDVDIEYGYARSVRNLARINSGSMKLLQVSPSSSGLRETVVSKIDQQSGFVLYGEGATGVTITQNGKKTTVSRGFIMNDVKNSKGKKCGMFDNGMVRGVSGYFDSLQCYGRLELNSLFVKKNTYFLQTKISSKTHFGVTVVGSGSKYKSFRLPVFKTAKSKAPVMLPVYLVNGMLFHSSAGNNAYWL